MHKIICLVGMTGSGKSTVADELVKNGYQFVRFGQITLDIVKERGLEPTEENEKEIRENLRQEHGMGAFATLNLSKFDQLLEKGNVVADGLYSWSEYKILKEHYGSRMIVLAVLAPPETRYGRLEARTKVDEKMRDRPATREQAQARDHAEIENIEKGGPIAMADNYLINNSNRENLIKETNKILGVAKKITRPSWDEYFLNLIENIGKRGTCDRGRSGSMIVKDKDILAIGYVGSPSGLPHCDDVGHQMKQTVHENRSISNHCVRTAHAEMNAICNAAKKGIAIKGATIYCKMEPCYTCAKAIINAGIKRVVAENQYHAAGDSRMILEKAGVKLEVVNQELEQYENQ